MALEVERQQGESCNSGCARRRVLSGGQGEQGPSTKASPPWRITFRMALTRTAS